MRLRGLVTIAIVLWPVVNLNAQAEMSTSGRLVEAAFFSVACKREAETQGVERTMDVDALLAAVAAFSKYQIVSPSRGPSDGLGDECRAPTILLINLLRLNGLDAELVLASTQPANRTNDGSSGGIDRIFVYIAALDRYLDPEAASGKQAAFDQIVQESMARVHFQGPALIGDARDACDRVCMQVRTPSTGTPPVVVKTEAFRAR